MRTVPYDGERAVVLAVKDDSIKVQLQDQRIIDVDVNKYKNIDYGYAMTTFKAQGQTYNKVIVDSDTSIPSLNDMRNVYVNITRARNDVKIYTDDKDFLKELAEIKAHAIDTLSRPDIHLDQAKEQVARLYGFNDQKSDQQVLLRRKDKGFDRELSKMSNGLQISQRTP